MYYYCYNIELIYSINCRRLRVIDEYARGVARDAISDHKKYQEEVRLQTEVDTSQRENPKRRSHLLSLYVERHDVESK